MSDVEVFELYDGAVPKGYGVGSGSFRYAFGLSAEAQPPEEPNSLRFVRAADSEVDRILDMYEDHMQRVNLVFARIGDEVRVLLGSTAPLPSGAPKGSKREFTGKVLTCAVAELDPVFQSVKTGVTLRMALPHCLCTEVTVELDISSTRTYITPPLTYSVKNKKESRLRGIVTGGNTAERKFIRPVLSSMLSAWFPAFLDDDMTLRVDVIDGKWGVSATFGGNTFPFERASVFTKDSVAAVTEKCDKIIGDPPTTDAWKWFAAAALRSMCAWIDGSEVPSFTYPGDDQFAAENLDRTISVQRLLSDIGIFFPRAMMEVVNAATQQRLTKRDDTILSRYNAFKVCPLGKLENDPYQLKTKKVNDNNYAAIAAYRLLRNAVENVLAAPQMDLLSQETLRWAYKDACHEAIDSILTDQTNDIIRSHHLGRAFKIRTLPEQSPPQYEDLVAGSYASNLEAAVPYIGETLPVNSKKATFVVRTTARTRHGLKALLQKDLDSWGKYPTPAFKEFVDYLLADTDTMARPAVSALGEFIADAADDMVGALDDTYTMLFLSFVLKNEGLGLGEFGTPIDNLWDAFQRGEEVSKLIPLFDAFKVLATQMQDGYTDSIQTVNVLALLQDTAKKANLRKLVDEADNAVSPYAFDAIQRVNPDFQPPAQYTDNLVEKKPLFDELVQKVRFEPTAVAAPPAVVAPPTPPPVAPGAGTPAPPAATAPTPSAPAPAAAVARETAADRFDAGVTPSTKVAYTKAQPTRTTATVTVRATNGALLTATNVPLVVDGRVNLLLRTNRSPVFVGGRREVPAKTVGYAATAGLLAGSEAIVNGAKRAVGAMDTTPYGTLVIY